MKKRGRIGELVGARVRVRVEDITEGSRAS